MLKRAAWLGAAAAAVAAAALFRQPATIRAQSEPPQAESPAPPDGPIQIEVDTRRIPADGPPDPWAVLEMERPADGQAPPWIGWASLDGSRVGASSSSSRAPAFAVRIPEGAAVAVANRHSDKIALRLAVRLPRGLYRVDRLVFGTGSPAARRVERMEPVLLDAPGAVVKPGWLSAGDAAVYRFVNLAGLAAARYREARQGVRVLQAARPSECRWILVPLRECESHVAVIARGIPRSQRYAAVKHVHRALLTASHARTLCSNFRGQGRMPHESGERLEQALDGLEESLAELSAGCLGLVPEITLALADPEHPEVRRMTVSVANSGRQSLPFVRIGASAPPGGSVRPADSATFRSLGPGQSVRATFTVRLGGAADIRGITAVVSYLAARVPARLRLSAG